MARVVVTSSFPIMARCSDAESKAKLNNNTTYIYLVLLLLLLMPSVRMATNDAADMCLSMKIPLLSLKVEDKDVRDHFDIMHLAKDGKKHLENNGNKYLNNNVHT